MKTVCSDKNCQETQSINMCPVKPPMDMQSREPAMKQSTWKFNQDDKNCQSTKSIKSVCDGKNCKSTQCVHMQTAMKSCNKQLPKPSVPYKYTGLCSDKNCQSTRCYKKKSPMRPMCGNDMNCQYPVYAAIDAIKSYAVSAKDCLKPD